MAPFPYLGINVSTPNSTLSQPQAAPLPPNNPSQWGPESIGTLAFGVLMLVIGLIALWQGRQRILRQQQGNSYAIRLLIS